MERARLLVDGIASGWAAIGAVLLLVVYGAISLFLLGVRDRLLLVAASVPTTMGVLALTAQLVGGVGFRCGALAIGAVALPLCAAAGALQHVFDRRTKGHAPRIRLAPAEALPWVGAGVGGLLGSGAWIAGIANFNLPPQNNDDIWHGFLIARLGHLHHITASSVAPVLAERTSPVEYYPYAAHLAAAFVRSVSGVSVPSIMNASWVVVAGFMLPFGVTALARALVPGRPMLATLAGVGAPGFTVFPYVINGLWPYALALACVPAFLALVLHRLDSPRAVPPLAIAVGVVALTVAHPAAAAVAAVAVALIVLLRLAEERRRAVVPITRLLLACGIGVLLLLPWLVAAPASAARPETVAPSASSFGQALWMTLRLATPWTPGQPAFAALVVAGTLVILMRLRQAVGVVATYWLFALLFAGVLADTRQIVGLTGVWYGDWYRLAAVLGLFAPVIAATAVTELASVTVRMWRAADRTRAVQISGIAAALALLLVSAEAIRYVLRGEAVVQATWKQNHVVTLSDVQLFTVLRRYVKPNEAVLNDWQDGSTWMYAIDEVDPAIPYDSTVKKVRSRMVLFYSVGSLGTNPSTCKIVLNDHVTYALVKTAHVPGGSGSFDDAVRSNPSMFVAVARGTTGTIYRLNAPALKRCAARAGS